MKKFFYAFAILLALPILASAQLLPEYMGKAQTYKTPGNLNVTTIQNDGYTSKYDYSLQSSAQFKKLFTTIDATFNAYGMLTPFVYDKTTNSLILVQTNRYRTPAGILKGQIFLYHSENGGSSWKADTIYNQEGSIPVNASIAVTNPTNSTEFSKLEMVVSCRLAKMQITPSDTTYPWAGGLFVLVSSTETNTNEEVGPTSNNPSNMYRWSNLRMFSSTKAGKQYYYYYGVLQPSAASVQYGAYGLGRINIADLDLYSSKPTAFDPSLFRDPGTTQSSYNSNMMMDADNSGNIYAVVNNMFSDNQDQRVVGVSKSTNNGETWGTFDRMPYSLLENFVTAKGGNTSIGTPIPSNYPYGANAFAVTGTDEYSFIYRVIVWSGTSSSNATGQGYIVEASKKAGTWTLKEVCEFSGGKWRQPYLLSDTLNGSDNTKYVDGFDDNYMGHELQLAKTADGNNLVLKFIDNRDELTGLGDTVTLVNNGTVDTVLSTDIFFVTRPLTSATWGAKLNATNDKWNNKITWIPNIVPSIDNIPVIEHATTKFTNQANLRYAYPYFLQNYVVESGIRQDILFGKYDVNNPNPINNPVLQEDPKSDVEEVINLHANLYDAYPNPASEYAELSYNLEFPANVELALFNILGEKIQTIYAGEMSEGLHANVLNTSNLTAGTYYFTLTLNGKSLTKVLNVVK